MKKADSLEWRAEESGDGGVFGAGADQGREVGVGVLPEGEEGLVLLAGGGVVALHFEGLGES